MDFQRIFILLGLAVTSYMLVLAWNEDYGPGSQAAQEAAIEAANESVNPSASVSPDVPVSTGSDSISNTVPDASSVPMAESSPGSSGNLEIPAEVPPLQSQSSTVPSTAASPVTSASGQELIHVRTDVLDVTIDPRGGDIVRVALPAFPTTLETPDVPFLLVDPRNSYVAQSGLIGPNGTDVGSRPLFSADQTSYEMGDDDQLRVTLRYRQDGGAEVLKHFVFKRSDYLIDLNYEINNQGSDAWQGALFVQIKRDSQEPLSASENLLGMQPYVGGATRSESEFYRKLEFDDIEDETYRLTRTESYMAMVQHYFVSAWVPVQGADHNFSARKLSGQDVYLFGFTSQAVNVAPGQIGELNASYYVGPKDQYRLQEIAAGLDLTVDYGFLWWLAQPMFYMLTVIQSFVGNWGIAIICLTIFIKALLYPLSASSFRSMAKLRKLQPEMVRLKERFGDDREKFSKEMMDLYKREGANPLGGCLPILLQMPVFLALYWTLMESVELRQAPFYLWIDDLSAMDPYFVLPILMGISMYLTQMMQPEPPDPVQAKVFKLMPIMFTFFFLWFPSGLVLYWLVNNILSIMQQYYVTRQIEKAG